MKKNGFTLIELLAVIVILAIIALIATPIVLNIIGDTKDSATISSAEFYNDAVELAIPRYIAKGGVVESGTYEVLENGNLCLKEDTEADEDELCDEELLVDITGEKPNAGSTVKIESGKIKDVVLNYDTNTIVKDENEKLVYQTEKTLDDICGYANVGIKGEIGAKYACKVNLNKPDHLFYILSYSDKEGNIIEDKTKAESVNLILERNICEDGSFADLNNTCLVEFWDAGHDSSYGPVTAMNYLYNATSEWTNIPDIKMNYEDEGKNYGTIKTENGLTKITKKDGTAVTVLKDKPGYSKLKVRMPYRSEVSDYSESLNNAYLFDNLNENEGYYTLSSKEGHPIYMWFVSFSRTIQCIDTVVGVRPVINLKI